VTEAEQYAFRLLASQKRTTSPCDCAVQTMMIRSARNPIERAWLIRLIMDERAEWRRWLTDVQRTWQTRVSRRPMRGNHHDSWAIRESYVRGGNWTDHMQHSKEYKERKAA
jgi:hypothetical protein